MKIIGIIMVKNEDIYIRRAIENIEDFCDDIIVIDTGSTDNTRAEVNKTGVSVYTEYDLKKTHRFVEQFVNTDTWVFGVDGDEIYDPEGLKMLRKQITNGFYDEFYQVQGRYLHATCINGAQVSGYEGPPSHTPCKLYNMSKIKKWKTDGKHILFLCRPMITEGIKARALQDTWEETPLRCVHTRFLRRSSSEGQDTTGRRLHGEDILGYGNRTDRGGTDKINERLIYKKGPIVTKGVYWL